MLERLFGLDFHQDISTALFAGFDNLLFQSLNDFCIGNRDTARSFERNQPTDTQFNQFLNQKLLPVAFGQRDCQFEMRLDRSTRRDGFLDSQGQLFFGQIFNDGEVFNTRAVKQDDGIANLTSHDMNRMMSLIAAQFDAGIGRLGIQKKTL